MAKFIPLFLSFYLIFLTNECLAEEATLIHPSNGAARTYERLEIGVTPPAETVAKIDNFILNRSVPGEYKTNPYVSWSVRYFAIFTHESSPQVKVEGFYFQDFTAQPEKNVWQKQSNNHPFRFRAALPAAGEWLVQIFVSLNREEPRLVGRMNLKVTASVRPGFVKTHPNHRNLMRGDKIIFPVGANLFSPIVDNNLYYSGNPKDKLNVNSWTNYLQDLRNYANSGGKFVRFIMEPTASEIEFEKVGDYTSRLPLAQQMDSILFIAEEKDILVQWNCMIQSPFKITDHEFGSWDFIQEKGQDRPGYGYSNTFQLEKPSDIFYHPEAWRYFKERYRYIIARWGYSPQITFFELMSEPFWMNKDDRTDITPYDNEKDESPTRKAVAYFHREMSQYIKNDLQHSQHLLAALSHLPSKDFPLYPHGDYKDKDDSWDAPHIDVISINMYKIQPNHFYLNDNNVLANRLKLLSDHYGKPIFFSETQTAEVTGFCSNHATLPVDVMTTGFVGVSGFNIWEVFFYDKKDPTQYDDRVIWPTLITTQQFFQQRVVPVMNKGMGDYRQVSTQLDYKPKLFKKYKRVLEMHYVTAQTRNEAVGSVYNRTYNVYTNQTDSTSECAKFMQRTSPFSNKVNITGNLQKVKIEGLNPRLRYEVSFYDFQTGKKLESTWSRTNGNGKLKFKLPSMTVIGSAVRPAIWFSVKEGEIKPL